MTKLNNPLLPHQQAAVDKLSKIKVGALLMEQGTGKSITTAEICRIRLEKGKIEKIIWLCPCSAKGNIKREILKQCPDEMVDNFIICGIETLSSSVYANAYLRDYAGKHKCFLIVDESLLVKNPFAVRTKNILKIAELCPYRMILNGTPVSRNEADLYAQFYILDWRILGYKSYWSFAANHLEYDKYGKIRRVLDTDYLAERIAPYSVQVKKSDCLTLPPKVYCSTGFYMTPEQNKEYDRVAEILMEQIDEFDSTTVYRLFSGLQAVMSGKKLTFNSSGRRFKTEEMFEDPQDNPRIQALLYEIEDRDDKIIIFCNYESEVSALCSLLPGAVRFDGKVSVREREKALKAFSGDAQYLIANRACAGYSLNLQFCHRIIYLSNSWDLGTRLQSEDRVHRIGQTEQVSITDIYAYNSLDVRILRCLDKKTDILDSVKRDLDTACKNHVSFKTSLTKIIRGKECKEVFDLKDLKDSESDETGKQKSENQNVPA